MPLLTPINPLGHRLEINKKRGTGPAVSSPHAFHTNSTKSEIFPSPLALFFCSFLFILYLLSSSILIHFPDIKKAGQMTQSKKILVVQPNQEFAKSHFSFTINLVHVLSEAGHQVHLLVPLINESEKLDNKLEEKFTVIYFLASEELRKAEEEYKKHGPPIGMWRPKEGLPPLPSEGQSPPIANGNLEANGTVNGMVNGRPSAQGADGGAPSQPPRQGMRRPMGIFAKVYLEMASDDGLMSRLKAQNYDIGIAEAFMNNEWSLALFRLLRLPRIVVTTAMGPLPEFYYYLGMLARIKRAMVPALRGTKIGDHEEGQRVKRKEEMWQSFVEAVTNHLTVCIEINVSFQELAERLFGIDQFPVFSELFAQVDVYLVNSQPEIDWPAAAKAIQSMPNGKIRYVGGMNALRGRQKQNGTVSTLNPEILARANGKKGMVLFSLGTVLDTNKRLGQEQFEAIKEAMGRFPDHLFIWKLTEGDARIEQLNEQMAANVYAAAWVDQPAILAHPSTVAFISHCGMNSALEAAWNGIPLVCIPCMGDQYYNSEALASKGVAVVLDFFSDEFTGDVLAKAIGQILDGQKGGGDGAAAMEELGEVMRKKDLAGDILTAVIGGEE